MLPAIAMFALPQVVRPKTLSKVAVFCSMIFWKNAFFIFSLGSTLFFLCDGWFAWRILGNPTGQRTLPVGGWSNPSEKYARQIRSFPQGSGWKLKNTWNHPPDHTSSERVFFVHWTCLVDKNHHYKYLWTTPKYYACHPLKQFLEKMGRLPQQQIPIEMLNVFSLSDLHSIDHHLRSVWGKFFWGSRCDRLSPFGGGFPKMVLPNKPMGFPTKNRSFWGVKWGYHHLRNHPGGSNCS